MSHMFVVKLVFLLGSFKMIHQSSQLAIQFCLLIQFRFMRGLKPLPPVIQQETVYTLNRSAVINHGRPGNISMLFSTLYFTVAVKHTRTGTAFLLPAAHITNTTTQTEQRLLSWRGIVDAMQVHPSHLQQYRRPRPATVACLLQCQSMTH